MAGEYSDSGKVFRKTKQLVDGENKLGMGIASHAIGDLTRNSLCLNKTLEIQTHGNVTTAVNGIYSFLLIPSDFSKLSTNVLAFV